MTQQPPASLLPALDLLRRGDRAGARRAIDTALLREPGEPALLGFGGLLAAQAGDEAGAIPYFRRALAATPQDLAMRINLATALVSTGALDEAAAVAAGHEEPRLLRIAAWVHQQQGRADEAAAAYRSLLAAAPEDFESWNNLGNVLAEAGDLDGAITAFQRAITLRPDIVEMVINLSDVLARAERSRSRQAVVREAARVSPDDPRIQTELGLAEAGARDTEAAERAFRAAIRLDRHATAAWLELGLLFENLNRVDELAALVAEADAAGERGPEIGFLKAWALRRQNRFAEALPLAEAVPETISPIRRAQLLAELYERVGRPAEAFAAFGEMNRAALAAAPAPQGPSFREIVQANAALMTPALVASWTGIEVAPEPPSPIFIVGFPRSGTTLLDTLLMNLPNLHVLEELPIMADVEASVTGGLNLGTMTSGQARTLRRLYFNILAGLSPPPAGATVVDKHPLHMARMPMVHRLFPDAKVVLVERHPCDAVLSCFMANFQLNAAMRSFTDLEEAARTYDAVFTAWERAETLLPIRVHRVRYERMIEDLAGEMRPLLDFLGLDWDEKVLDNQGAAAGRGQVRTASYAQVGEPIYQRAAGRWERYREQLAPVLPILAPWAEKLGYGPLL
jgi:tetratricopeptide (TPR) repeat protein